MRGRFWLGVVVLLAGCAALPSQEERPPIARELDVLDLSAVGVREVRAPKLVPRELDPSPLRFARPIHAMAFAPDGKLAATDGITVRVFDREGALVEQQDRLVQGIAFTSSSELVAADAAGIVFLKEGRRLPTSSPPRAFAISSSGKVAWCDDEGVHLDEKTLTRTCVETIAFSPDERWLAAFGLELASPIVWRLGAGFPELVAPERIVERYHGGSSFTFRNDEVVFEKAVTGIEVLPLDGLRDLGDPATFQLFEDAPLSRVVQRVESTFLAHTRRGIERLVGASRTLLVPTRVVKCDPDRAKASELVAFSPDGTRAALARGCGFEVFDLESGRIEFRTPGHALSVSIAFSGEHVATFDGVSLVLRDLRGGERRVETRLGASDFVAPELAFSPDGRVLAAGDTLFDRSLRPLVQLPKVGGFAFSGKLMAFQTSLDGWHSRSDGWRFLDLETLTDAGPAPSARSLAFAPELEEKASQYVPLSPRAASHTRFIAAALVEDTAHFLWDLGRVHELTVVRIDRRTGASTRIEVPSWTAALAPDARHVAFGDESSVVVRDLVAGTEESWRLRAKVTALAFSPSLELVAGLEDGSVHLLERSP